MSDIKLKLLPMKPRRKVPPDAHLISVKEAIKAAILEASPDGAIEQRLVFIEKLVLDFRKDLSDLRQGVDFNDARLNKVIRLADVLARKAGIPD